MTEGEKAQEGVFVAPLSFLRHPHGLISYLGVLTELLQEVGLVILHGLVLHSLLTLVEGGSSSAGAVVDGSGGSTGHTGAHGGGEGVVSTGHDGLREIPGDAGQHDVVEGNGGPRIFGTTLSTQNFSRAFPSTPLFSLLWTPSLKQ